MRHKTIGAFSIACALVFEAHAQAPVIGQGGAAPGPPIVNRGAHPIVAGPAPTIADWSAPQCGNAVFGGSDVAGYITYGTTSNNTDWCALNFSSRWQNIDGMPSVPICVVRLALADTSMPPPAVAFDVDYTAMYFKAMPGETVVWQCVGSNDVGPPFFVTRNPPLPRSRP
jgi:hypothetical protein